MNPVRTVFPIQDMKIPEIKEVKPKFPLMSHARRHIARDFPQVKHIVDATEQLQVEVAAYDRVTGKVKNPQDCAMARACRRKFGLDGAIISLASAYLIKGDTAVRYKVPATLAREVVTFDRNKNFAPGTYLLGCFAPSNRLGVPHHKTRNGKSERQKPKFHNTHTDKVRDFYDRAVHKGDPQELEGEK
jgi:hypothetical protein